MWKVTTEFLTGFINLVGKEKTLLSYTTYTIYNYLLQKGEISLLLKSWFLFQEISFSSCIFLVIFYEKIFA